MSAGVGAFSGSSSIDAILALMASADYAEAQRAIDEKLKHKDLSAELRAQLYWHKALCHLSENQNAAARSSLLKLLTTNPFYKPDPNASPKILALYHESYANFKAQGGLENAIPARFIPLESSMAGDPIPFQVAIVDKTHRKQPLHLEFHIRKLGNSEFSSIDFNLNKEGVYEVTIPPLLTKGLSADALFEYYVDFIAEDGARIGGLAKRTLPLTFLITVKSNPLEEATQDRSHKNLTRTTLWVSAATLTLGALVFATVALRGD